MRRNKDHRRPGWIVAAAFALLLWLPAAKAQTPANYTSGTYLENFDTTPYNTNGTDVTPSSTPVINGTTYTLPGADSEYDLSDTLPGGTTLQGWYAVGPARNYYGADGGDVTTGGIFSFGAPGGTNRSLGTTSTSSTLANEFGVLLYNNSSTSYNQFTLSYTSELWHQGTTAKTLNFGYDVTSTAVTLPNATVTAVAGLGSGSFATGTTTQSTNISAPVASNTPSATVSLSTAWTAGTYLWLTWTMNSSSGSGQGIGIDSLSFSAGTGLAPANVVWNTTSGTWDTTTPNWTGGSPNPNLYKDSDNATFSNTAGGTVTVTSAGVAPGSTTVSASGGTYSFTGGAIDGSGTLAKSGNGTLVLAAANGYSGGTTISGGTLIVSGGDNRLGAAGGGIAFAGGTLQTNTTGLVSARGITVNTGGATINTNSLSSTTSGSTSIQDTLNVTGGGTLGLDGATTFGNNTGALNIPSGTTVVLGQTAGTVSMNDGGTFYGNLVIANGNGPRINFNNPTTFIGAGQIQVQSTGTLFSNASGSDGGTVNVNVSLNSTGLAFTKGDVTQATYAPGSFVTTIGGTKLANAGDNILTFGGTISGASDLNVANTISAGGGSGNLQLNAPNTYTGATTINSNGGNLIVGINNALPATTDVIFGTQTGVGTPQLDLNGFNQQINSLSSGANGTAFGVTNNGGTPSILTVSGSTTPANPFTGNLSDGTGGGTLSLTKSGSGTLTLAGTNTFSGTTLVSGGTLALANTKAAALAGTTQVTVNNTGTLLFAANDQIVAGVAMTLGGGAGTPTLNTGGYSQDTGSRLGALTLSSGAIINFASLASGNSNSILAFANSSPIAWTGVLSIDDYAGSTKGGGTDQLYFGTDTTGLSSAQLNHIAFYSDAGATFLGDGMILGDGEVVPGPVVPEPSTLLAAGLALGLLAWRSRRYCHA